MVCICPKCGNLFSLACGYICPKCGWTDKLEKDETIKTSYASSPCKYCDKNPANDGDGICFCTLGLNEIRF